jgi:cytochrome c biogenesis protein CcmG/thiol:disulfide interchange protein DsbE
MYRKAVVLAALAVALMVGCTRTEQQATAPAAAPDFTLTDLTGKKVHLADLKGKVVLLEFWATWCPPCQASIPGIERLHRSYGGKGLVVLGVSVDEGASDSLRSFVAQNGITYTVLRSDDAVLGNYLIRSIPSLFLVNKDGMIAKQYLGEGFEDSIEKDIRSLL